MVGQDDDQSVAPLRQLLQRGNEASHPRVGVGKGVEDFVGQTMVRHIEGLVRTARLNHVQLGWQCLRPSSLLRIVQRTLKHQMVGHSPLAEPRRKWKIAIGHNVGEAHAREIGAHVSEVGIATIIIMQGVALLLQHLADGRQLVGLGRIAHETCRGLGRIATQNGENATIGAEAVCIEIIEEEPFLAQRI